MKKLTVIMQQDPGASLADADVESLRQSEEFQAARTTVSEAYLSQLRLRVEQDPSLLDQIEVFYQRGDCLLPVGLREEDEIRWPAGFMQDIWRIETEIQKLRNERRKEKATPPVA